VLSRMAERRIWHCGSDRQGPKTKTAAPTGGGRRVARREGVPDRVCIAQAASLIFSAATAKRFEIGWKMSPASFSAVSLFFEVSAISWSKAERA
jgi:hypothetical protein